MTIRQKTHTALIVVLACLAAVGCGPKELPIHEVAESATVQVRGVGLEKISVSVSTSKKLDVVIPAGTRFSSRSPGTQNMMSAKSVTVSFPPEGQSMPADGSMMTQTIDLDVYCINRFLDVPTEDSQFTVSTPDPSDPLSKFARCVEGKDAEHHDRQFAVWILSDNLWDYSVSELAKKEFHEDIEKKMRNPTWDDMAEMMKEMDPNFRQEDLDTLKQLVEQAGITLKQLAQQQLEASRDEFIRHEIEDIGKRRSAAQRLLEECGHDISGKPLFLSKVEIRTPDLIVLLRDAMPGRKGGGRDGGLL